MEKNHELVDFIPQPGEKGVRSWYPILLIVMCIQLVLNTATSFRAAPKVIYIVLSRFSAVKNLPIPTYKSIRRWLARVGLYKLNSLKEQGTGWAFIVDNSVQIGMHKCLTILGIRLSKRPERALSFDDVDVIALEMHEKSHAKCVHETIKDITISFEDIPIEGSIPGILQG